MSGRRLRALIACPWLVGRFVNPDARVLLVPAAEPLERLAAVVRAAGAHDLVPQAAGLLARSVGLSRMVRDDLAQLDAGPLPCDAFHRWARGGFEDGHGWPAGRAA